MPHNGSGQKWLIAGVMLLLAAIAGLAVALASGSQPGPRGGLTWTPPPTRTPTPTQTARPSPPPPATRTPTRTATSRPPTAAPAPTATMRVTAAPTATATRRLTATATAAAVSTVFSPTITARVIADPVLRLRTGPGEDFPVVAGAATGAVFTVTGRSRDAGWLRVCCVNNTPVWLSTQFVAVTGVLEQAPVVEP